MTEFIDVVILVWVFHRQQCCFRQLSGTPPLPEVQGLRLTCLGTARNAHCGIFTRCCFLKCGGVLAVPIYGCHQLLRTQTRTCRSVCCSCVTDTRKSRVVFFMSVFGYHSISWSVQPKIHETNAIRSLGWTWMIIPLKITPRSAPLYVFEQGAYCEEQGPCCEFVDTVSGKC